MSLHTVYVVDPLRFNLDEKYEVMINPNYISTCILDLNTTNHEYDNYQITVGDKYDHYTVLRDDRSKAMIEEVKE